MKANTGEDGPEVKSMRQELSDVLERYYREESELLQSAFVAGAEFASLHGSEFENLSIFFSEWKTINTEAAKRYPKGGCDED